MNNKIVKITVEIPEDRFSFQLENAHMNQYRVVVEEPNINDLMYVERKPFGPKITVITSNMPDKLQEAIEDMIEKYCNHK